METPAVSANEIRFSYANAQVLNDVSLAASSGEVLTLLGPNGAGKTTTVEILEGYKKPSSGTATVLGANSFRAPRRIKEQTGLMLQTGGVQTGIKVREVIDLHAAFYPAPRPTSELTEQLGLSPLASRRYRDLSGGEQQRVAFALS